MVKPPTISNTFWQFDANYWFKQLNTSANGLLHSSAETILKQSRSGRKTNSHFKKDILLLLEQFKSPLMWLLIGATLLFNKTDLICHRKIP